MIYEANPLKLLWDKSSGLSHDELRQLAKLTELVRNQLENMAENMEVLYCLINQDNQEAVSPQQAASFMLGYSEHINHIAQLLSIANEAQAVLDHPEEPYLNRKTESQ